MSTNALASFSDDVLLGELNRRLKNNSIKVIKRSLAMGHELGVSVELATLKEDGVVTSIKVITL